MEGVPSGLVLLAAQALTAASYSLRWAETPEQKFKALDVLDQTIKHLEELAKATP